MVARRAVLLRPRNASGGSVQMCGAVGGGSVRMCWEAGSCGAVGSCGAAVVWSVVVVVVTGVTE